MHETGLPRHEHDVHVGQDVVPIVGLGAAERNDREAVVRRHVAIGALRGNELALKSSGLEQRNRVGRVPVGEQRRLGEPPCVHAREAVRIRVEWIRRRILKVDVVTVALGMEHEAKRVDRSWLFHVCAHV